MKMSVITRLVLFFVSAIGKKMVCRAQNWNFQWILTTLHPLYWWMVHELIFFNVNFSNPFVIASNWSVMIWSLSMNRLLTFCLLTAIIQIKMSQSHLIKPLLMWKLVKVRTVMFLKMGVRRYIYPLTNQQWKWKSLLLPCVWIICSNRFNSVWRMWWMVPL